MCYYLSISYYYYLFNYLSIHLFIYLFIYLLFIYLFIYSFMYLFIYLFIDVYLCICTLSCYKYVSCVFVLYSLFVCNELSSETWVLGHNKTWLTVLQIAVVVLAYDFVALLLFVTSCLILYVCVFTYFLFFS